jgi:hypothetical protein
MTALDTYDKHRGGEMDAPGQSPYFLVQSSACCFGQNLMFQEGPGSEGTEKDGMCYCRSLCANN